MAYDEALASRVRETLGENPEITERKMFGGIAFMLSGQHGGRSQQGRPHGPDRPGRP